VTLRVLCAPNAFKGTLTSLEAARAMAGGVRRAGGVPTTLPMADGGDGTMEVLALALGARLQEVAVSGPLGRPLTARLAMADGRALLELAEAAGMRRLERGLAPLDAGSRGAGEMLGAALAAGCERFVMGLGGSACTDGGAGMLSALGWRLLDGRGGPICSGGRGLLDLAHIEPGTRLEGLVGLVDVDNPLLGPDGAAAVYGPQKGASPADVALLESGLERLAAVAERDLGTPRELAAAPGAGAAGGCGFGLLLLGAELSPGAGWVATAAGLDAAIAGADVVLTGEGRLDRTSLRGKAPGEVARRAGLAGVPCIAIAGQAEPGWRPEQFASVAILPPGPAGEALTAATEAAVRRLA
jgi:glycerate kinase